MRTLFTLVAATLGIAAYVIWLLVVLALAFVAGDVLGLWEAVSFV